MSPLPLDRRIDDALRLSPMTIREIARVLSVHWHTAWIHVDRLRLEGRLHPDGQKSGSMGAPATVWRAA